MLERELLQQLNLGLQQLGLALDDVCQEKLIDFLLLLKKWNKTYNLTAITDPKDMLYKHLLDSLAVAPFINGLCIIDVGTGGGLPGIPLAICYPNKTFTLLDSKQKKTRFLLQAKQVLQLDNIDVVTARVEQYQPDRPYDEIITRAFASAADILQLTQHLTGEEGRFLLMKANQVDEELAQLPTGFEIEQKQALKMPNLNADRFLVVIKKSGVGSTYQ